MNEKWVTVCAWCGATKVDECTWMQEVLIIDSYITHGICPECTEKELYKLNKEHPESSSPAE